MEIISKDYKEEYSKFIAEYDRNVASGESIGSVIIRMAQYFAMANMNYATALNAFNRKAAEIEATIDATGKSISSSKAKIYSDATPENATLNYAKTDVENIEQFINATKALQKGILVEYQHSTT